MKESSPFITSICVTWANKPGIVSAYEALLDTVLKSGLFLCSVPPFSGIPPLRTSGGWILRKEGKRILAKHSVCRGPISKRDIPNILAHVFFKSNRDHCTSLENLFFLACAVVDLVKVRVGKSARVGPFTYPTLDVMSLCTSSFSCKNELVH